MIAKLAVLQSLKTQLTNDYMHVVDTAKSHFEESFTKKCGIVIVDSDEEPHAGSPDGASSESTETASENTETKIEVPNEEVRVSV
jgi:hypothetical protein